MNEVAKYDTVGIRIGVDFEEYSSVKKKLDALLTKFQQSAKTIDINIDIKDVNKQLQEIEKTIKTLDKASNIVAKNMAKNFSQSVKTASKEMEKATQIAQKASKNQNTSSTKGAFSSQDDLNAYTKKVQNQLDNISNLKLGDTVTKQIAELRQALDGLTTGMSKTELQEFKNKLGNFQQEANAIKTVTNRVNKLKDEVKLLNEEAKNGNFNVPSNLVADHNTVNATINGLNGKSTEAEILKAKQALAQFRAEVAKTNAESEAQLETQTRIRAEIETAKKALQANIDRTQTSKAGEFLDASKVEEYRRKVEALNAGSMDELRRTCRELNIEWDGIANNAQRMANNSSFLGSIGGALKSMSSYYLSGQMISKMTQGIKYGVQSVIEMDTALVDLKKVADETDATLNAFVGTANKMAIELGHSTTAVISSVSDYIKVGYQFKEAQEMAQSTIIYSNVGDMDISSATESMISTMKAFKVEARDSIDVVDKLNEVANKYAVSASGLGEALKRSASSMAVANNSLDQTLAIVAGANAVVQNESKVGNALKTISMRLRGISEDTGELIPSLRETFMLLTNNKVDIMADEDTFKSTYDIMVELGGVWDTLTDKQRAYLAELSAGKTQANVFVSIMENIKEVEQAYDTSLNSQGSAMREQERYMESLQAKVNALKETVVAFWNTLIDTGFVGGVLDGLTSIVALATKLVDVLGTLPTIITLSATALGALKGKQFAEMGVGLAKTLGDAKAGIGLIAQETMRLKSTGTGVFKSISQGISNVATVSATANTALTVMKTTMISMGVGLGIGIAIDLIVKLITHITQAKERMEEAVESAKSNINGLNDDIKTIQELSSSYEELSVTMGSLSGFQNATTEQQKEYLSISEQLLDVAPDLAVAFTDEGDAIVLAGQSLESYIERKKELIQVENEILAINSRKLLKEEVKDHEDKMSQLEEAKKNLDQYQRMVENMKTNGLSFMHDDDGNLTSIKLAENYLEKYTLKVKELQAEVLKSDTTLSEYANNILRVNKTYNELSPTGQQAVQTIVDFDKTLLDSDDTLNGVIESLGQYMSAFDDLDIGSGSFDIKAFEEIELKLHEYLETLGLSKAEIVQMCQLLLNPYKQAWIEANSETEKASYTLAQFNEDLKTMGGEVLDHADNIITLKEALKELDESHGLSSKTLRSLVDQYPELITAIGDEERQRRILMDAVSEQEDLQSKVIDNILAKEKEAHLQKISFDNEWYTNKKEVLMGVLQNVEWANTQELQQAKNLAQAKIAIDNEYAKRHADLMKRLYTAGKATSVNLAEGTKNSGMIKTLEEKLNSPFTDFALKESIKNQINLLKQQDQALLGEARALENEYNQIIKGFDDIALADVDFSSIGDIKKGLNSVVNKPSSSSSSSKKNTDKEERTYTYDGNELDKYANALEIIIDQIDDYDQALEEAYAKKQRLHDKKLYEDEITYIDKIIEQEKVRGASYQNRIRDIEANNKAVLDAFKKQEGFDLSTLTRPEFDKKFNEKYGAEKVFKTEAEKKAWENKAKAFESYVDTYFKGMEQIEDLNSKLLDNNEALVQLNVDKYSAQLERDKEIIESRERVVDAYSKELEILRELNQEDFSLQNYDTEALEKEYELLGNIAGKQHLVTEEIKAQIEANMALLATLKTTDARYATIVERVKELTDAQHDSYLKELQYRNEIKSKLIEEMSVELEKSLYGSDGQQAWEDANDAQINALEEQLKVLKKQTDEKKKQEESEKRLLEIQQLRDKLENLKRQKTIQQLKKNADGSWEWEYVADQEAISEAEKEIKEKEKEHQEQLDEDTKEKEEEALQDKIDKLQDEAKIRSEAYQRMLNDLKKHMNSQENIFEMSGNDINKIVNSTLDTLDKVYNGKFSNIIESMREKAKELSSIFEDARDDAEDWYNDAVYPTGKGDDEEASNVPSTSKPDKTESEKEAWHSNKDRIAKQMEKNAQAWKSATPTERKRLEQENEKLGKSINAWKNASTGVWYIKVFDQVMPLFDSIGFRKFETGGETQETGLQWLDGKKGKPERVLSAEQTKSFNRMVEIMPDFMRKMELFSTIAPSMSALIQGAVAGGGVGVPSVTGATPISTEGGQHINIENVELPNVTDFEQFRKEMAQFLQGSFSGLSQSAKVQKSK